jgi:hypothetical protein
MFAYFNRFSIQITLKQAESAAHQGDCEESTKALIGKVARPRKCNVSNLAAELEETGAWTKEELQDDEQNWIRILWIAACNIKEEYRHRLTSR